jgi:hypothetical protein
MKKVKKDDILMNIWNGDVVFHRVIDIIDNVMILRKLVRDIKYWENDFSGAAFPLDEFESERVFVAKSTRNGVAYRNEEGYSVIAKVWDGKPVDWRTYTAK